MWAPVTQALRQTGTTCKYVVRSEIWIKMQILEWCYAMFFKNRSQKSFPTFHHEKLNILSKASSRMKAGN